jgi:hypothetical protein
VINKLGDQDEQIVGSLLKTLDIVMNKNVGLAGKIQKEVSALLNRTNLPERVKFMAYTLLANVDYAKVQDQRVCSNSLNLFCKQSQALLKDYDNERDSKLLNQCLRGINRILPSLEDKNQVHEYIDKNADYFFKLSHVSVPRVKIQILLVLFQILKHDFYSQKINRYYRVVYEMILNPSIVNSNLNEIFLEL